MNRFVCCALRVLVPGCGFIALASLSTQTMAATPPANVCVQGYVWREAYSGDTVCVTPQRRSSVLQENAAARSHVNPSGGAYGRDTCLDGYVWRQARDMDHVCVPPQSRTIVAQENEQARHAAGARTTGCNSAASCRQLADNRRKQAAELKQKIAARKADLAAAKESQRRALEKMAADDREWERTHPGLGRSTSPSIADNISPIQKDIDEMEQALSQAQSEAASADAQAARSDQ